MPTLSPSPSTRGEERPSIPLAFQWVGGLGGVRLVASVPVSRRIGYVGLLATLWAFAIGVLGFLGGVLLAEALGLSDWLAVAVAGVIWSVAFGAIGYRLGTKAFRVAVLYDRGVALQEDRRIRAWEWDDIVAVERLPEVLQPDIPTDLTTLAITAVSVAVHRVMDRPLRRVVMSYRFHDATGETFALDGWLEGVEEIAAAIDAEVSRRVAPRVQAALDAGEQVSFGAVIVSAEGGIMLGAQAVAWDELRALEIERDQLHFGGLDGKRLGSVSIKNLRNLTVLLQVLRQGAGRDGPTSPKMS